MARVLIVDDEKGIRFTLAEFLRAAGHEVQAAASADEARRLLREQEFDVVLTDIILPGVSGVQLLQELRSVAPRTQVIIMTGAPTVETAAEAVRLGAADYLIKPAPRNAVVRSVGHAAAIKALDDERRALEETNRRYREQLERMVAERTAELQAANQRLETALAELQRTQAEMVREERLNALAQMVSGIAHDFNNALMPIVGLAELHLSGLAGMSNPEQLRADLTVIRDAGRAATEIVRRLREFYRPEEVLHTTSVDLARLVDHIAVLTEAAWKVQAGAEGRQIRLVNELQGLPPVPANESGLAEVLVNLVLNAVDAMPEGGEIRFQGAADEDSVTLRVSDTGRGMSAEAVKRCFEPFFTTKGERGSGLGLAVAYGIISRHGGEIAVESQEGRGTTFIIRLPRRRREPAPGAVPGTADGGAPVPALRVLAVDDEEWARHLLVRFLTAQGHTVKTASSACEALQQLCREPADLVVVDRVLTDASGDQLAAALKQMRPGTPVIIVTGLADIMSSRGEKPAGVDVIIGKPVSPDALLNAVRAVLGKRPPDEERH